jgi:hypothetical protein
MQDFYILNLNIYYLSNMFTITNEMVTIDHDKGLITLSVI